MQPRLGTLRRQTDNQMAGALPPQEDQRDADAAVEGSVVGTVVDRVPFHPTSIAPPSAAKGDAMPAGMAPVPLPRHGESWERRYVPMTSKRPGLSAAFGAGRRSPQASRFFPSTRA